MTPYEQRWLRQLEIKAAEHHVDIIRLWRRGSLMPQDYPGYPFGEAIIDPTFSTETQPSQTTDSTTTQSTQTQSPFTDTTQTVSTASFTTFTPSPDCDDDGVPTIQQQYTVQFDLWRVTRFYFSRGAPVCSTFILPPISYDCASYSVVVTQSRKYSVTGPNGAKWLIFEYTPAVTSFNLGLVGSVEHTGTHMLEIRVPTHPATSGAEVGLCVSPYAVLVGRFDLVADQSHVEGVGFLNCVSCVGGTFINNSGCEKSAEVSGSVDPTGLLDYLCMPFSHKDEQCLYPARKCRYDLCSGSLLESWKYNTGVIRVKVL